MADAKLTGIDITHAGAHAPRWPMPVADFLAGSYLEPADILLMRQRRSLFARLVRLFTGSFFSKAALVFLVPHHENDFDSTFIIEANFKGIDLTDLASFFAAKEKVYVVAVKRYERDWFQTEERNLVRGFMLSHIKSGYDFSRLIDNFWAAIGTSGFVILRLVLGPRWVLRQVFKRGDGDRITSFIGPGFVQWGYRATAKALADQGTVPAATVDDVIFSDKMIADLASGKLARVDEEALLSITAEDLAKTRKLAWKYAIIDGEAHEIASEKDFFDKVAGARANWLARRQDEERPKAAAGR